MKSEHRISCRKFARQIWREQKDVTPEEMIRRTEITEIACEGMRYAGRELMDAICPLATPDDELPRLAKLDMWTLEDAVSVWRDINPFLVYQAMQASRTDFWTQAFHPSLRTAFDNLYEQAMVAVHNKSLDAVISLTGAIFVDPSHFYQWAIKVTDGPNGDRPQQFFFELSRSWSDEIYQTEHIPDPSKPRTGSRDAELQKAANEIASSLKSEGRRDISKREVARKLASTHAWNELTQGRIERIIRVEW